MTAPADVRQRALVARHVDGWLVGWFAVAVWAALWVAERSGTRIGRLDGVAYWLAIATSAMHFGITYHLAYANPRAAMRRRPVSLFVVPVALLVTLIALVATSMAIGDHATRGAIGALLTSAFLLTIWHYIKQAYGVARLGASSAEIVLTTSEMSVLRYCLYPLWAMSVARLLSRGTPLRFLGYRVGAEVLPHGVYSLSRGVAVVCTIPIVVVFVRVGRRRDMWPPALMIAPYVASFLWLAVPVSYVGASVLLAAFHAMQYLSCAHRAELALGRQLTHDVNVARWLELFIGAMCAGLLLSTWMPGVMDRALLTNGRPLLFSAAFFVFLNLHHYLVDAVIWRSKGELVRSMVT